MNSLDEFDDIVIKDLEDMEYFQRRLMQSLRIPPEFMRNYAVQALKPRQETSQDVRNELNYERAIKLVE